MGRAPSGILRVPLGILASIFEEQGVLNNLEAFTSLNGSKFYKLEPNKTKILLVKENFPVEFPKSINTPYDKIKVFDPDFQIFWHVRNSEYSN